MANPLDRLLAPTEAPATTYRWGHVVDPARPIQVILDNETEPIEAATLTGASLGDRVLVALNGRRATILGKAGGARLEDLANVSTTAPSTGDRLRWDGSAWVPEPPLPTPHSTLLVTGSATTTSATWANIGTTTNYTVPAPLRVLVSYGGLPLGGASTTIRVRLAWEGATTGNAYDYIGGNWALCLSGQANTTRDDADATLPLTLNTGTTTFRLQALREIGTATPSIADVCVTITPIAWA